MLFANVAAGNSIKNHLLQMAQQERVAHALLFFGEDGGAQLPLATAFAQYMFCANRTEKDSCGTCSSCIKINKLAHPDLHLVFPIALSKDVKTSNDLVKEFRESFLSFPYLNVNDWFNNIDAENKQPVIPAEESNEIIRKLSYTSYEGKGKIMIIWMPEKMNASSANKLLKMLEEPPDETFFFLVSSGVEQMLPTILSRTQLIKVDTPAIPETAKIIAANFNMPQVNAEQLVALSQGNARQSFLLADENIASNQNFLLFQNLMRHCLRFDAIKISGWIDEFARLGREKQKQFLIYSLHTFRNCILTKHAPGEVYGTDEEKEFLKKFSNFITLQNHEALVEEFNKAFYHIERNASAKILCMDLALKTNELLNKK